MTSTTATAAPVRRAPRRVYAGTIDEARVELVARLREEMART
jgi:hypothetical protein